MLPGDDQLQRVVDVVGPLKFALQLPETPDEYFSASGVVPTIAADKRRFVRKYMRATAALQHRPSLPNLERSEVWHKVVTRDLSRNGISFLHSEQAYPKEQWTLVLPDCKPRCIEVVRCRRLAENCYEVGANFIPKFRAS